MKTLPELLQLADPVRYEPGPNPDERRRVRAHVLGSQRTVTKTSQRRRVPVTVVALLLMGAAGAGYWSWLAVEMIAAVRFEVRLAEDTPANDLQAVPMTDSGRTIYIHAEPFVTNADIASAEVRPDDGDAVFAVALTFTEEGAEQMLQATRDHVGRPLAILIDGKLVAAPVLKSPISNSADVNGIFTRAEAERIVNGIIGR